MEERLKIDHFHGKTALQHIAELQAIGISSSTEIHGAETPGPVFAFLDALRETLLLLSFIAVGFHFYGISHYQQVFVGIAAGIGWMFWKGCRSAFLAWSRLNRLHRIALEEKEEIETNRGQEREELIALYKAKGLEGVLLDRVVDVLMADQDRLLRVMLQEEMGYRLEEHHHPIVQGIFAAVGVLASMCFLFLPFVGVSFFISIVLMIVCMAATSAWFAYLEKNAVIPAFIWNMMIGAACCIFMETFMEILLL